MKGEHGFIKMSTETSQQLMLWGNLGTAVAYFVIAGQLVLFVNSQQVSQYFRVDLMNIGYIFIYQIIFIGDDALSCK